MESPHKPKATPRTRDASAFARAPVVKPAAQKTRARYTALQQSLLDRQIPPRMVRYITQHFHAKAKIDAFIELYRRGCHLTGKTFSDRYDPKDPKPDACVPRKDGTLVCLAVHILTQEGVIPDNLLLAAAHSLVAHARRAPTPPARPIPTAIQPKEPAYDTANIFGLGAEDQDYSRHDSDTPRQPVAASASYGPGKWEWDEQSGTMVHTAI